MNKIISFWKSLDNGSKVSYGILIISLCVSGLIVSNRNKVVTEEKVISSTEIKTVKLSPTPKVVTDDNFVGDINVIKTDNKENLGISAEIITPTNVLVPTLTPTLIPTITPTVTVVSVLKMTAIPTLVPTATLTPTLTPTFVPTVTVTPTITPILTPIPTNTLTPTPTVNSSLPTDISLSATSVLLYQGEKQQLNFGVVPNSLTNDVLSWNYDGYVINMDGNGLITAKNAGTTNIVFKTINGLVKSVSVTVKLASSVKIAVIADVHDRTAYLKTMLERAKKDKVELMVIAGDLTWKGEKSELESIKQVLDASGVNRVIIPGNHDSWDNYFASVFGINYQSRDYDGIRLIMIDNSQEKAGLGETQKAWIVKEFADCKNLVCVAIMHEPLYNPSSAHIMGEYNEDVAKDMEWLKKILISSGIKVTISGHIHEVQTYTWNGVTTYLVGPGRENIFSEFVIKSNSEVTRTVVK